MYKNKILQIILFLVILNTRYLILDTVKAHAEISLGVYPPITQIDATPPTSIRTPIAIQNPGDNPVTLDIRIKLFTASDSNNGVVRFLTEDEPFPGNDPNIFQKMQLLDGDNPIDSMTLAPQQEKQLELHIALPKDEPPGDYYFSIIFSSKGDQIDQTGSGISAGIATNVLLSIGPKTATTGNIKKFSSPWIVDHGPFPIKLLVNNTSDHFTTPRGTIVIKNMFGQIIGRINLAQLNVLSNSSRYMQNVLENKELATTDANDPIILWPETFLLGPYSAHLSLLLSDNGPLFERTLYFFALPVQFAIGFVIVGGIIAFIVLRVRKRLKK